MIDLDGDPPQAAPLLAANPALAEPLRVPAAATPVPAPDLQRGPSGASRHRFAKPGGISTNATEIGHDGAVGTRILAVEDDERIRTAVKLALEDEGWEVEEADNGEDALDSFSRHPTDVVLIDIMLPGHRRLRGLPVDPAQQRRPDRHGHRPGRHPRRGGRPRGRAPTTT